MKTGRPKKYDNLVKTNVYVEQKTLDDLNTIVDYLNKKSQFKNMTLAAVIRKILSDSSKSYIQKKPPREVVFFRSLARFRSH